MSHPKVRDLLAKKGEPLQLEVLTGEVGLDREIPSPEASSPGLVLSGYTDRFVSERLHVLGETEIKYLGSLDAAGRRRALETLFGFDVPCVIITKGQDVPPDLLELAKKKGVPVIRTSLKTADFYSRLKPFLDDAFAPRRGNDVLIGRGIEVARHHMEIRGVGLIDINALFGVRSVRQQKRIEVVVQLEDWDNAREYDRTGLDGQETEILGVRLPLVAVPLNPGKNLTVICEVVAMNHLLRYSGVDTAKAFNERLIKTLKEKRSVREYLEEDYE